MKALQREAAAEEFWQNVPVCIIPDAKAKIPCGKAAFYAYGSVRQNAVNKNT